MAETKRINILVTLDANYIFPLRVMLHSLLLADEDVCYTVYVAHASLTQADLAQIRSGVPEARCTICPIEVSPQLLADAPVLRRLSTATYYRLLAPSFLPPEVDRILYLDPDITVLRSLWSLYSMDMQGMYLAAAAHLRGVMDWLNRNRLRVRENAEYLNAGVLLMDVRKLRALDNTAQIFDFVRTHARLLFLGDQDVINVLYDGHVLFFDTRIYNLDERVFRGLRRRKGCDLQWVRDHTAILHYNGRKKPWNLPNNGQLGEFFFACRADMEAGSGETL